MNQTPNAAYTLVNPLTKAPISAATRAQLRSDVRDIRAAAVRKNVTLDAYEERREREIAKRHFELGCWLHYYAAGRYLYKEGEEGLKSRIECAQRLFLAGIWSPGYDFFTIFDFGERHFDTIFEMGDADEVVAALRSLSDLDTTGRLKMAVDAFGWNVVTV